ncbi:MAG: hypothetical protein ACW99A_06965 [Candidatus Kariarchaeaceae archaeon]|jgi:hypothetical protein
MNGPETGDTWVVKQDWSDSNQYAWSVESTDEGLTSVVVYIRDKVTLQEVSGGYYNFEVRVINTPLVMGTVVHNAPSDPYLVNSGDFPETVTFTASGTGASGVYEYSFYMYGPETGYSWTMVQGYSASDQYSWTVDAVDVGLTSVAAYVRDTYTGEVVSDGYYGFDVQQIGGPLVFITLTQDAPSDPYLINVGDFPKTVTYTASATGGSGDYYYRFWMYGPETGNTWVAVQGWDQNDQFAWTVDAVDAGKTSVAVFVYDNYTLEAVGGGYYGLDIQSVDGPLTFGSLTHDSTDPLVVSGTQTVTFTASATGATGDYYYQFWMYGPETGDTWVQVQSYSKNDQFAWTVDASDEGLTSINAYILDSYTSEVVSGSYVDFEVQVP